MKHARHALYGALFVALLFLSGCATGAMRIDVEVYKGPLAQTSDAQFASLIGYLEEAKRSLVENMNFTLATVANAEFEKLGRPEAGCSRVYLKPVNLEDFLGDTPWPAAGFKDTKLGVSMKLEVRHGATQVYARVQG